MRPLLITCLLLAGCDIPEEQDIPTGAICTLDGFVLRPVPGSSEDPRTWQFILDETGGVMTCVLQ